MWDDTYVNLLHHSNHLTIYILFYNTFQCVYLEKNKLFLSHAKTEASRTVGKQPNKQGYCPNTLQPLHWLLRLTILSRNWCTKAQRLEGHPVQGQGLSTLSKRLSSGAVVKCCLGCRSPGSALYSSSLLTCIWEAAHNGSSNWVPATHLDNLDWVTAFGL